MTGEIGDASARQHGRIGALIVAGDILAAPERYRLRWFTPSVEVDLCGHATLAAAHVVFTRLRTDATSAPRSWTAPMKIAPKTTQSSAGSQPHVTATAGPTIGPAPAIVT